MGLTGYFSKGTGVVRGGPLVVLTESFESYLDLIQGNLGNLMVITPRYGGCQTLF